MLALILVAQLAIEPSIEAEVMAIRAIDNHAHPMTAVVTGAAEDHDYDILPLDGSFEVPMPATMRFDNPLYAEGQEKLFGRTMGDGSDAAIGGYVEAKQKVIDARGDAYPAWVLDQLGVDVMLANRVSMSRGVVSPRFRWVPFIDQLLFPTSTEASGGTNGNRRHFFKVIRPNAERMLRSQGLNANPKTLEAYLRFVTKVLEQAKKDGAVAVKSEAAYLRDLDIGDPTLEAARKAYESGGDEKALGDYLFRHVAREAGRLGLPLHIHVSSGAGADFHVRGVNPMLLEPLIHELRGTTFVIVHGGYPYTREAGSLLLNPNVYADFSAQTFLTTPRAISKVLREWLNFAPEKVLYGTDALPMTPFVGWEETGYMTTKVARKALAMALTEMVADGEITRAKASEIAQMVMRGNAAKLYKIETLVGP